MALKPHNTSSSSLDNDMNMNVVININHFAIAHIQ